MTVREGAETTVSLTRKCLDLRGTGPKPDLVLAHREWVTHTQGPWQHSWSVSTESRNTSLSGGWGREKSTWLLRKIGRDRRHQLDQR